MQIRIPDSYQQPNIKSSYVAFFSYNASTLENGVCPKDLGRILSNYCEKYLIMSNEKENKLDFSQEDEKEMLSQYFVQLATSETFASAIYVRRSGGKGEILPYTGFIINKPPYLTNPVHAFLSCL